MLWQRNIPPVVVVVLRSNDDASCHPPPPSLLRCSSPPTPLRYDISAAVITVSSSSPCPLLLCHLTPAQVAASATTLPSLHLPSSPQPPPHRQPTMSSLAMTALLLVQGTSSPTMAVADVMLPPTSYLNPCPPQQSVDCHFHAAAEPSNISCASRLSLLIHGRPRPQDLTCPCQPAQFDVFKNVTHALAPP